ncbi:MAG: LytTR family transcriptional regulator DNA-binding domain-containing protein [Lewinella sp.]
MNRKAIATVLGLIVLVILFETLQQLYYVRKFELAEDVHFLFLLQRQVYRWLIWLTMAAPLVDDYCVNIHLADGRKYVMRKSLKALQEKLPGHFMRVHRKYIMNGFAVQDETLKADGKHSGSIRQYDAEKNIWLVHYYASASTSAPLPHWTGSNASGEELIFSREQKAPNGAEGTFRLRFHDISKSGYRWVGAWVSKDESVIYPTWKIECTKPGAGG